MILGNTDTAQAVRKHSDDEDKRWVVICHPPLRCTDYDRNQRIRSGKPATTYWRDNTKTIRLNRITSDKYRQKR